MHLIGCMTPAPPTPFRSRALALHARMGHMSAEASSVDGPGLEHLEPLDLRDALG